MTIAEILVNIIHLSEFIAFVVALVYWCRYRETKQWVFLPFMVMTLITEISAYILKFVCNVPSSAASNTLILCSSLLLFYWFYTLLRIKWLFQSTVVLVIIAYGLNIFYQPYHKIVYQYPNFLIGILMLVYIFTYMRQLLNSNEVVYFKKIPALWICSGLIVYQLILVLLYMMKLKLTVMDSNAFMTILTIINVVFYASISYGLILSKKNE
ncbi:MAG: hypothetical protein NWQ09_01960 [Nonlabens sp.]|nr:hypothetical protein [Nonlabens sp.]